jgi:streptomycin 6-kinase
MLVDPRWELKWLGEDPGGVLVETPTGEQVMLKRERLTNYARVENKLIPKDNVPTHLHLHHSNVLHFLVQILRRFLLVNK